MTNGLQNTNVPHALSRSLRFAGWVVGYSDTFVVIMHLESNNKSLHRKNKTNK